MLDVAPDMPSMTKPAVPGAMASATVSASMTSAHSERHAERRRHLRRCFPARTITLKSAR